MGGWKSVRHPGRVFFRLDLHPGEGFTFLLGLYDPNRLPIDVEQVVRITVTPLEGELADGDPPPRIQVHPITRLDPPTRLDQGSVDLLAGAFFRGVEMDQG